MVLQYRALWNIPGAGPAVSVLHFGGDAGPGVQEVPDVLRDFFATIASYIPNEVSVGFDSEVITIDTASGQMTESTAVTPPATVVGSGTGSWAAGSGARLVLGTNRILNGRRVRGALFIVPLATTGFDTTGATSPSFRTNTNAAAVSALTAWDLNVNPLVVYSRPRTGSPGTQTTVSLATVAPMAATLRSRKY